MSFKQSKLLNCAKLWRQLTLILSIMSLGCLSTQASSDITSKSVISPPSKKVVEKNALSLSPLLPLHDYRMDLSRILPLAAISGSPYDVGTLPGHFKVSSFGQATYDIPIQVIPGTNGMAPHLTLHYDSGAGDDNVGIHNEVAGDGNGLLGMGFRLTGLSAITRTSQTLAQDGHNYGVNFTDRDRFALDGQELVATSGSYGANGTIYHTYFASQSRIISHNTQGAGPQSFSVQTKNGQTAIYGGTTASRILANGPHAGTVQTWALSSVHDQAGNTEAISYTQDSGDAGYYPSQIAYTSNSKQALAPYAYVKFAYSTRPDPILSYKGGSKTIINKLLTDIKVFDHSTLVWDYHLSYAPSPNTGRERLQSVQKCDAEGDCLPPTTFTWQTNQTGWVAAPQFKPPFVLKKLGTGSNGNKVYQENGTRVVPDMIGNGLPGLVHNNGSGSGAYVTTPQGWQSKPNYAPPTAISNGTSARPIHFVDLNSNGLPDILIDSSQYNIANSAWLNTGSGWQASNAYKLPEPPNNEYTPNYIVDLNGNGRLDVTNSFGAWLNTGSGWLSHPAYKIPMFSIPNYNMTSNFPALAVKFVDMTGSGLPDLLADYSDYQVNSPDVGEHSLTRSNSGNGWSGGVALPGAASVTLYGYNYQKAIITPEFLVFPSCQSGHQFVDLTGDGLQDVVQGIENNNSSGKIAQLNTGAGTWVTAPSSWQLPIITTPLNMYLSVTETSEAVVCNGNPNTTSQFADLNNDGIQDLIGSGGAAWLNEDQSWVSNSAYHLPAGLTLSFGDQQTDVQFVDLLGTGFADIIYNNGQRAGAYLNKAQTEPDVITGITNGLGAKISLAYKPITNSAIYTKGHSATFPNQDYIGPYYVVSQTSQTADENMVSVSQANQNAMKAPVNDAAPHIDTYHYSNAILNLQGWGFLGFGTVAKTDASSHLVVTTTYNQNPAAHLQTLPLTKTTTHQGTVTDKIVNTYTVKNLGSYYLPYISKAVKTAYTLSGGHLIDTSTTTTTVDSFNNPTEVKTTITTPASQTWMTDTVNTYTNQTANGLWLIGELTHSTVSTLAPGSALASRASSYTYYPTTGYLDTAITEPSNTALTHTITDKYNVFGEVTQKTLSANASQAMTPRVTQQIYDSQGRFVVKTINPLGETTTQTWNGELGKVLTSTDSNQLTTTYTYDPFGHQTQILYPDHTWKKMTYQWITPTGYDTPSTGNLEAYASYRVATTSSTGQQSDVDFDQLGRVIETVRQGFDGKLVMKGTAYDELGRVAQQILPFTAQDTSLRVIAFTYDDLGRETLAVNPDGSLIIKTYNGLTSSTINQLRQTITTTDNPHHKIIKSVDSLGHITTYGYDGFNDLTSMTDSAGHKTTITYNSLGEKTAINDPDRGHWTYTYNPFGEVKTETDARGNTSSYTYDLLGRKISRTDSNGGTSTWTYGKSASAHNVDKLVSVQGVATLDKSGHSHPADSTALLHANADHLVNYTKTMTYDAFARPSTQTTTIDSTAYVTKTSYDGQGRPSVITYPSGLEVQDTYNGYDYLSRISNVKTDASYYQINSMNSDQQITSLTHGNGLTTTYTYDPKTRFLTTMVTAPDTALQLQQQSLPATQATVDPSTQSAHIKHPSATETTHKAPPLATQVASVGDQPHTTDTAIQHLSYTYDFLGDVLTRDNAVTDEADSFAYDGLDRLETAHLGSQTLQYTYDALGNLDSQTGVGQYTYSDQSAGPHAVTSITGAMPSTFSYDADGNQITATINGITRHITYTSFDKPATLTAVNKSNQTFVTDFYYNANRQRFERDDSANGTTTVLYYLDSEQVESYTKSGQTTTQYKDYVAPGTEVVTNASSKAQQVYYMLTDNIGSVDVITNSAGQVLQRYSYQPFGQRKLIAGSPSTPPITHHAFTGQELVENFDVIHMNGRLYDPVQGRFLSPDPNIQAPTNSQSLNRYSYVLNNPLALTDPTGFFAEDDGSDPNSADDSGGSFNGGGDDSDGGSMSHGDVGSSSMGSSSDVMGHDSQASGTDIASMSSSLDSLDNTSMTVNLSEASTLGQAEGDGFMDNFVAAVSQNAITAPSHALDGISQDMGNSMESIMGRLSGPGTNLTGSVEGSASYKNGGESMTQVELVGPSTAWTGNAFSYATSGLSLDQTITALHAGYNQVESFVSQNLDTIVMVGMALTGAGEVEAGAAAVDEAADAVETAVKSGQEVSDEVKVSKLDNGVIRESIQRKSEGRDGGKSEQVIERDANKNVISRTHRVTKDGDVVHQHQNHIGKYGSERQFPDQWTGTETINAPYENHPPQFGPGED